MCKVVFNFLGNYIIPANCASLADGELCFTFVLMALCLQDYLQSKLLLYESQIGKVTLLFANIWILVNICHKENHCY